MEATTIQNSIHEIRGRNVMLDMDLAKLYEVETKALKQAVRRNISRFPEDFMFQLTKEEWIALRSQSVTLERGKGNHPKYTFRLHRTRSRDAQCNIEFSTSNSSKYSNHACLCHNSTMGIHAPGTFRKVNSA